MLFQPPRKYDITIKAPKREPGEPGVTFLGRIILSSGINPVPDEVAAVWDYLELCLH